MEGRDQLRHGRHGDVLGRIGADAEIDRLPQAEDSREAPDQVDAERENGEAEELADQADDVLLLDAPAVDGEGEVTECFGQELGIEDQTNRLVGAFFRLQVRIARDPQRIADRPGAGVEGCDPAGAKIGPASAGSLATMSADFTTQSETPSIRRV